MMDPVSVVGELKHVQRGCKMLKRVGEQYMDENGNIVEPRDILNSMVRTPFEYRGEQVKVVAEHTFDGDTKILPNAFTEDQTGSLLLTMSINKARCSKKLHNYCKVISSACPFDENMNVASICCKFYDPMKAFVKVPEGYRYICRDGHEIVMSEEEWDQLKCDLCREENGLP